MVKIYTSEREGQEEFYNDFLPMIDKKLTIEDILSDNTDGILNGNLIEFKLNISNLNSVLFQTVKYMSSMRIKGKTLPKYIVLISLNKQEAYRYLAEEYLTDIEKVYVGAASKNTSGFSSGEPIGKIKYDNTSGIMQLVSWLKESGTTRYHVDENCIVGLADRYYKNNPSASKIDFLGDEKSKVKIKGEIRNPYYYKDTIIPYEEETNEAMAYIMDMLNPNFMQKDLGAFYTPKLYAKKSHELVHDAIRKHQESGNDDYVIIDTAAGSGNLEELLNEDVPDDIIDKDILSHCILNTLEYMEYKVLHEKFSEKVRLIIPPIETKDTFNKGLVRGSDALSEEFIFNEYLQDIINDIDPETKEHKTYTIIVFENPPYAETTSIEHQKKGKGKESSSWKDNFAVKEAKRDLKGAQSNDMANVFIWKAKEYYLRKPEDSLIVYSPIKYWKNANWMDLKFERGFGFNRKHFHTTSNTVVTCLLWSGERLNEEELKKQNKIEIDMFDIVEE